jgi:hypothetical protein
MASISLPKRGSFLLDLFIIMVQSDSDNPDSPSPRVSSKDPDEYMLIPDPDDSCVVQAVSGNGFQIVGQPVDGASLWSVPSLPLFQHVAVNQQPKEDPAWITEA